MKITTKNTKNFFEISNLIEGVDDDFEVNLNLQLLVDVTISRMSPKKAMYYFHMGLGHLNNYCDAGVLRDYVVYVGGRECSPNNIEKRLDDLFKKRPDTWQKIKNWHIKFETIHPFGDGNGRVGRFLMLLQARRNKVEIPDMFFDQDGFAENRQEYYKWFK